MRNGWVCDNNTYSSITDRHIHLYRSLLTDIASLVQESMTGDTTLVNSTSNGSVTPNCCNDDCSWTLVCSSRAKRPVDGGGGGGA